MPRIDIGEAPPGILDLSNEEILREFELTLETSGASRDTIKSYMAAVSDFLSFIGNKPLREITARDILNWRNDRLRNGFNNSKTMDRSKWQVTLHYYTIMLRRFLKWLGLDIKVPGVKKPQARIDVLSDEELQSLLRVAKKPLDRLILSLLISTGLRSRELLELRVEDVDFNRQVLRVRSAKYGRERYVTATPEVFDMIDSWIKLNGLKPGDKLFSLTYSGLYKKIKTLAKRAGIDTAKIRPHVLRHTFATLAIRKGMSLPSLQRLLGHSDIRTTQIYLHLTIDDIKREYEEKFADTNMVLNRCINCNREIPRDASYCPYCGINLGISRAALSQA
ncbi:MAG: tyrosine-type recombinase/integrase [Desulfurococcaceae archaeon]